MKSQCLAIVPARSGSKGLVNKNILPFKGIPLIAHTIQAAKDSGIFSLVHVSTDSNEYAKIANEYGADVPFLRSDPLSKDSAKSIDVVDFVISEYLKQGKKYDYLALLQPTSPLRT